MNYQKSKVTINVINRGIMKFLHTLIYKTKMERGVVAQRVDVKIIHQTHRKIHQSRGFIRLMEIFIRSEDSSDPWEEFKGDSSDPRKGYKGSLSDLFIRAMERPITSSIRFNFPLLECTFSTSKLSPFITSFNELILGTCGITSK